MPPFYRDIPDLVGAAVFFLIQWRLGCWAIAQPSIGGNRARRLAVKAAVALSCLWIFLGLVHGPPEFVDEIVGRGLVSWVRGLGIVWALVTAGVFAIVLLLRRIPQFNPRRRRVLQTAGSALLVAPVAVTGFGVFVERTNLRVREVKVPVTGLPKDLDGLRVVQLSDIHLSPYLSEREVVRAVEMANETRAHLALVTGDLISSKKDPLDACLRAVAELKADAGILGCLGNHETYAEVEDYTWHEGKRLGIQFLRSQARLLRFGGAELNFVGVDHQPFHEPYLVGVERFVRPGKVNVLLSHNPDVFPVAVEKGYGLTISGHTHGGQINVEILHEHMNIVRFFTPYVYGLYRRGAASIYVTRGIGTVGVPARIGAPPEIALIRLCAT